MLLPKSHRAYLIFASLCASLALAACGDSSPTTDPGTAQTTNVTTTSSSQAATAPATTVAAATGATITASAATTTPATAPAIDITKTTATIRELDFLKGVKDVFFRRTAPW